MGEMTPQGGAAAPSHGHVADGENVTKTRPDDGRPIVPRPVATRQPSAVPIQAPDDRLNSVEEPFVARYMRIFFSPRVERILVGGYIAMMIGIPLLIGYLYVSGEVGWAPPEVLLLGVLIIEAVAAAQFIRWWRNWR